MLTRKDFKFGFGDGEFSVNGIDVMTKIDSINAENNIPIAEQQFVDFLNAILPQDGYRERWVLLKRIVSLMGYEQKSDTLRKGVLYIMQQIESEDTQTETKTEGNV